MKRFLAFVAFAAFTPLANAQQHVTGPNPADAAARVPQAAYDSAFAGYNPYREQDLAAWREVNDEVARIGGHVRMFGGARHAGPGSAKPGPARPAPGQPAVSKDQPAGERSAPQAPQAGHKGH
jgi:hypothetical protein